MEKDRMALAVYSLILGDTLGVRVEKGLVEYHSSGSIREVQIRSVDRGRVLRIRDRVRLIKAGQLPERPEDAPCQGCSVKDRCETHYSLASRFF